MTVTGQALALKEMRAARRKRRLTDVHWVDALYRVYVLAIGVGGLVWYLATVLGERTVNPSALGHVRTGGPAAVGAAIAALLVLALRSGQRGGPVALEMADVQYLLGAPIPPAMVLRRPFVNVLRRGLGVGAIAGAVVGRLAEPFLGGSAVGWMLSAGGVGALVGLTWMSVATGSAGNAKSALPVRVAVVGVAAAAAADVFVALPGAPTSGLAALALSPMHPQRSTGAGSVFSALITVVALIALAVYLVGEIRVEQALRRARLVSQLRFAVTTQDLRAVLLLRRQIASEHPRSRPWFRVKGRSGASGAVIVRCIRSVARWPLSRIWRLVLLGVISGVVAHWAWDGILPVVAVAGLCGFIAGLDAVEALSQDADHPNLLAGFPRHRGRLANRQVIVPMIVVFILGIPGAALGALLDGHGAPAFGFAAVLLVCWAASGVLGAAINVAMGPPDMTTVLQSPELAAGRSALSPMLCVIGVGGPLLWAHATASGSGPGAASGLVRALMPVSILCYFALTYLTSGGVREPGGKS